MASSLHQVTEVTKKLLIVGGVAIGGLICLLIVFQIFLNIKEYFFPSAPTPPTVAFGKLTSPTFPANTVDLSNFSYTLTTITGSLPILPEKVTVYKTLIPQPSLLQFQKTQSLVSKVGFINTPVTVNDAEYIWTQGPDQDSILTKKLLYNIATLNFALTSNYKTDASVSALPNVPDQPGAVEIATKFFTTLNSVPSDIDTSLTTTELLTLQNETVIPASSLSNANLLRVNFFQKAVDSMPVFYLHSPHSSIYTIISGGANTPDIVEAGYFYKGIDSSQHATYPIKTAQQAFNELKNGKAFLANYDTSANKSVIIRTVSLGYYLGETDQTYAWPVIVFQGDHNFIAYVSAVTDAWIEK